MRKWSCGICQQPPAFSRCAAGHGARPTVKHYPCSEWGWCYVTETQKVEKQNTETQTNATFPFFFFQSTLQSTLLMGGVKLNSTPQTQFRVISFSGLETSGQHEEVIEWNASVKFRK